MWRLYYNNIILQIRSLLEYRISFLLQMIGVVVGYSSSIIIFWMMFSNFESMGGWSFRETMFVYSFSILSINLAGVFFNHFKNIEEDLIEGNFQYHLIRPYSAFSSYMISKFNIAEFVNLLLTIILFIFTLSYNDVPLTGVNTLIILLGLAGAVSINSALLIIIGGLAFWTLRSSNLYWSILWPAQYLAYMPIGIFPILIQKLFTYVIPLVLIGSFPASILLRKSHLEHPLLSSATGLTVGLLFFVFSLVIWQLGIKKYEGTGS